MQKEIEKSKGVDVTLRIQQDHGRFQAIIRGRLKQNLKEYIQKGELIAKHGNDVVSVPLPRIELPQFRFGERSNGVIGQGQGKSADQQQGNGQSAEQGSGAQPGSDAAEHVLDVEVTLDELADILGEEFNLPRILNKGRHRLQAEKMQYTSVRPCGPDSLKHFKRSFKNALRRQMMSGTYNPKNPIVVPIREDMRYRSTRVTKKQEFNAVIVYMMDVSGSMGEEQKEIVRIESFWIDAWLRRHYDGIHSRYVIHDAVAKEVDRDTFFHTRESGGTMISSAYRLCAEIIEKEYPPMEWNIYPFHFSDGDNWSADDTRVCLGILQERILPLVNQFGYGQVESPYGSGQFVKDLREHFQGHSNIVLSEIKDKVSIKQSIQDFLKAGR